MPNIFQRAYKSTLAVCQRHDLSPWRHQPKKSTRIYGMYHIWCAPGWESMVKEQMERLRDSGLLAHTDRLYISCIVKDKEEEGKLRQIVGDGQIEFVSVLNDGAAFEFPALDYMYDKSRGEDFVFYYFHTKGISYHSINTSNTQFMGFRAKIEAWRKMMEHFLMDEWQVATNVLEDGYDTYGCYLFPPFVKSMYAGNFGWARADYFRTLPKLTQEDKRRNRFLAEEWLLSGKMVKAFSAFDTVADLYDVRIDCRQYEDGKHSTWQSLRFFLVYTMRKYQKKWFHYSYKHHCQKLFQKIAH